MLEPGSQMEPEAIFLSIEAGAEKLLGQGGLGRVIADASAV